MDPINNSNSNPKSMAAGDVDSAQFNASTQPAVSAQPVENSATTQSANLAGASAQTSGVSQSVGSAQPVATQSVDASNSNTMSGGGANLGQNAVPTSDGVGEKSSNTVANSVPSFDPDLVMASPDGGAGDLFGASSTSDDMVGNTAFSATDPIMKPEPAPVPDPVEQELKSPMHAAEPVPGSIGSAISGPASGAAQKDGMGGAGVAPANGSVSFNDPATQQATAPADKKKNNKIMLIALAGVLALAAIILVIVLLAG